MKMCAAVRLLCIAIMHRGLLAFFKTLIHKQCAVAALYCFQCLGEECEAGICTAKATSDDMQAVCFRAEATDGFGKRKFDANSNGAMCRECCLSKGMR